MLESHLKKPVPASGSWAFVVRTPLSANGPSAPFAQSVLILAEMGLGGAGLKGSIVASSVAWLAGVSYRPSITTLANRLMAAVAMLIKTVISCRQYLPLT